MKLNSKFPRDILNELKYRSEYSLDNATIYYVNRGSPEDIACKSGKDIYKIDTYYVEFYNIPANTCIPYHRIMRIEYESKAIFKRNNKEE